MNKEALMVETLRSKSFESNYFKTKTNILFGDAKVYLSDS